MNRIAAVCYPGSKVPEWFRYNQTTKGFITIELSSNVDSLSGFVICLVISQSTSMQDMPSHLKYRWYFEDGEMVEVFPGPYISMSKYLNSHHVMIFSDGFFSQRIIGKLKRRENDQGTNGNPKL